MFFFVLLAPVKAKLKYFIGDQFVHILVLHYVEGTIKEINIDLDKLSFLYLLEYTWQFGHVNVEKLHYRACKGGKSLEESLRIMYEADSFSPFLSVLYDDNCIDLYIEHDEKPYPLLSNHNPKEVFRRLCIEEHGRIIN